MADEARRKQLRKFAEARQAERGDYEPERGDYEPERGDYEPERGDYEPERGDYEPERGAGRGTLSGAFDPNLAAADIFRKAAGLGGHLIVAFVAPIGSSSPMPRRRSRRRASWSQSETAAASAHVAELIEQIGRNRSQRSDQRTAQTPGSGARVTPHSPAYATGTTQAPRSPTGQ